MSPAVKSTLDFLLRLLHPEEPEERLLFAVLERAILDATAKLPKRKDPTFLFVKKGEREEAISYLREGRWRDGLGWWKGDLDRLKGEMKKRLPEVFGDESKGATGNDRTDSVQRIV